MVDIESRTSYLSLVGFLEAACGADAVLWRDARRRRRCRQCGVQIGRGERHVQVGIFRPVCYCEACADGPVGAASPPVS